MRFADLAPSSGGFQPFSAVRGPRPPARREAAIPGAAPGEGTFSELTVMDGVGDFHANHFIAYGRPRGQAPPARWLARANEMLLEGFVDVFVPNDATVAGSDYAFEGADVVEFELGGRFGDVFSQLGGLVHSDWVVMRTADDGSSFHGSTLKREWLLPGEQQALSVVKWADWDDWLMAFIDINQHHFLAGRRSFAIGYDADVARFYVETAAFERSSLCEYSFAERSGLLREIIVEIWSRFLRNVEKRFSFILEPTPVGAGRPPGLVGYAEVPGDSPVYYRAEQFRRAPEALDAPWFAEVTARRPELVAGVSG